MQSDDTGARVHSQQVLRARGWLTPQLERQFYTTSLFDYWAKYTSPWVVDAVRYFARQDAESVTPEQRQQLRKIADETAAIIDSGEVPDKRQSMSEYVERLDAAKAALTLLEAGG